LWRHVFNVPFFPAKGKLKTCRHKSHDLSVFTNEVCPMTTRAPSLFQSYLADLAGLAQVIPTAAVERDIGLAEVAASRSLAVPRPSWLSVFAKAAAFVAAAYSELRQVYLPRPRPRLYEHPFPVVSVALERALDDEIPMIWARLRDPGQRGLAQLDAELRRYKEEPAASVGQVRRLRSRSRFPWPLRSLLLASDTMLSGRRRVRRLGTLAVASVGCLGAGLIDPLYPATGALTFGTIESGGVKLRLKFDTRVLTPWTSARILQDVERALRCELALELRYSQSLEAA
jgi:hypothetical protein